MNSNLDPIRILLHKAQDTSLPPEAVQSLFNAASHLDDVEQEDTIARWIEGRL